MKCGLFTLFLLALFFYPELSSAQQEQSDSLLYQMAFDHTLAVYTGRTGDQSRLYNGSHYTGYPYTFKEGSPYFNAQNFSQGSVVYDGILYPDVPLLFDDLRQKLITRDQGYDMQLIDERIGGFDLPDHHFLRILSDSLSNYPLRTGYYEVLYPGRSTALKKLYKTIKEDPTITEGIIRTILESTDYFIRTGAGYHKVNSKRELLKVMGDHKKEVQRFIRKNKLKFRKHKDEVIPQAAAYYDQLRK